MTDYSTARCEGDRALRRLHPPPAPRLTKAAALVILAEVAMDWAGEYGFSSPSSAGDVFAAVALLAPDFMAEREAEHQREAERHQRFQNRAR